VHVTEILSTGSHSGGIWHSTCQAWQKQPTSDWDGWWHQELDILYQTEGEPHIICTV